MMSWVLLFLLFMFEKKKIQTETLGEYLRQCRESLNLAEAAVAEKTGIKARYIKSLEVGDFSKLPPDVYVLGFLKQMSALYRADLPSLTAQYKKERGISAQVSRVNTDTSGWRKKLFGGLVITPKILSLAAAILFTAVTLGYIIYQVYSINRVPTLVILEPQDRQIIKDSFVNVKGKTDPGMAVSVNGQEIFVENSGEFKTQLGITPGPRDLKIAARNKFDKEAITVVSIIGESSQAAAQSAGLALKLDFSADVNLTFSLDSQPEQTMFFHQGDSKTFTAERKIVIGTTDAGATKVTLNGQPLGALGRPGEPLNNIPFFAETNFPNP